MRRHLTNYERYAGLFSGFFFSMAAELQQKLADEGEDDFDPSLLVATIYMLAVMAALLQWYAQPDAMEMRKTFISGFMEGSLVSSASSYLFNMVSNEPGETGTCEQKNSP